MTNNNIIDTTYLYNFYDNRNRVSSCTINYSNLIDSGTVASNNRFIDILSNYIEEPCIHLGIPAEESTNNTKYIDKMASLNAAGLLSKEDQRRYYSAIKKQNRKLKKFKKLMSGVINHGCFVKTMIGVDLVTPKEEQLFDEHEQLPKSTSDDIDECSDEDLGIAYSNIDENGITSHNILCSGCYEIIKFIYNPKLNKWSSINNIHKHSCNNKDFHSSYRKLLCYSFKHTPVWDMGYLATQLNR